VFFNSGIHFNVTFFANVDSQHKVQQFAQFLVQIGLQTFSSSRASNRRKHRKLFAILLSPFFNFLEKI
jgi:hypothetical protein